MSEDQNEVQVTETNDNEVQISEGHTEEVLESRGLGETIVEPQANPDSDPAPETPVPDAEPSKTLNNTDVNDASKQVSDLEVFGNGDLFQLLSKASSKEEGWMKSTKAMQIEGVGCVVQVTTQQDDNVAEALTFVPGVKIGRAPMSKNKILVRI